MQPGLIGGEVNKILLGHKNKHQHEVQYKIGPDPSSIDSCMVGGMVSNNSSGMCCGVSQNTYHTLKDMRIVFLDGTVLDTADEASRAAFKQVRPSSRCPGVLTLSAHPLPCEQLSSTAVTTPGLSLLLAIAGAVQCSAVPATLGSTASWPGLQCLSIIYLLVCSLAKQPPMDQPSAVRAMARLTGRPPADPVPCVCRATRTS